jgi:hypothetical protein
MDDDLVEDPGVLASDGQLPQDTGASSEAPTFLVTSPTISPLPASMDDSTSDLGDSALTGLPSTDSSSNQLDTSLLGFGESIGNSLLSAFVTGPQNAATAEGVADNNAALSLSSTSAIFGYLVIGLVIFLIFSAVEKK